MPSLTKDSRARSPYWICCYTSSTGQRLKKSTKQRDRKKAWEVCLAIERAEGHAKNGTLTEQTAKKIIGEIVERTTGEPLHNYKIRDWLAHWLDMKEQVRASKTTARYRQVIRDFAERCSRLPQFHHRREQDRAHGQSFREGCKRRVQCSGKTTLY